MKEGRTIPSLSASVAKEGGSYRIWGESVTKEKSKA